MGVRGYALTKKDGLLSPFEQALRVNPTYLDTLRTFYEKAGFSNRKLAEYIVLNNEYIQLCKQMIGLVKLDSLNEFTALLEEDRGLALWQAYSAFSAELINYENQIKQEAKEKYQAAVNGNMVLQIFLFLLGIPSLYLIFYRIRKQSKYTNALLLDLEQNNRKYVFDPGTDNHRGPCNHHEYFDR